jgi:hypothetical protein
MRSVVRRATLGALLAAAALPVASALQFDPYAPPSGSFGFAFARVQFNTYRARRRPGWAHDYPRAERNFLRILEETTAVSTFPLAHTVVRLDSPDIMKYPVLYFSEPGTWALTPEEAENLRAFLLRGGFAIFDDFDGFRDWEVLESSMARVLPGRHFELLEVSEHLFQSFFHIETLDMVPPFTANGVPEFHGIRDDAGRIQVIANYNNDIGDFWEWSDQGFYPIDITNDGYKLGINYVIYAMTH